MSQDLDAYIRALVDQAPPLTAEQRGRLAVLLRPVPAPVLPVPARAPRRRAA